MNPERNEPCFCGSGKKYKKCCLNKTKGRKHYFVIDFGTPTKLDGIGITHDNKIEFIQGGKLLEGEKSYFSSSYDRPKGAKIINRMELNCKELRINTSSFFSDYDVVFAIDTNTKTVNGQKISVSGIVLCDFESQKERTLALFSPLQCFEFRNIDSYPEKVAWKKFFESIVRKPEYKTISSIAVVVDAHLNDISKYNSRSKPIIDDYYLPPKIELIYASADVGKEYLPNRLIAMSDKIATKLLQHIEQHIENTEGSEIMDQRFSHFRLWHIK